MLRAVVFCSLGLTLGVTTAVRAQVMLEYKYPEGHVAKFTSTMKAKQLLTLGDNNIETTSEVVTAGTSKVGRRAADGTLPVAETIDAMRIEIEAGGMTLTFDSAQPDAKPPVPELAFINDVLKAIVGKELTVVLNAKNEVKTVEGAEKIAEASKHLDPPARELLKSDVLAERHKQQFEQSQGHLPQILVREGETWERTEADDIGNGQTLTFRRRYDYKGTIEKNGRTLDRIAIAALDVTYQMDPLSKSPLKAEKSDLKVVSSEGQMLFDREQGQMVERKEVDRIKGTMDFKYEDKDIPGKLDLTYESSSTRTPAK